jgi:uncharacterized protein
MNFVGRSALLKQLSGWIDEVASSGEGRLLVVRGRRQVGKSRLFTEFLRRADAAHIFFTAIKDAPTGVQLETFRRDALDATPAFNDASALFESNPSSWTDAFGRIRLAAQKGPVVVVLDEFPWAVEADPTIEGALQVAWDRHLQHLPVLLILVGSDVTMMERVTKHDRPLYGRGREVEVKAFNPAEVAAALAETSAVRAFDAFLVTGGYPRLVADLATAGDIERYLAEGLGDENSNLVVVAERSLAAEFPREAQARRVLTAIGGSEVGTVSFTAAVARLGEATSATQTALTRALRILSDDKGVVSIDTPAGTDATSRLRRYRIADPYLRFWFRFVEPETSNIARGRSDLALTGVKVGYSTWRGMAIEPVVHAGLNRLSATVPALNGIAAVGAWWNRDNSTQVDVVGTNRKGGAEILGSIKWRERRQFSSEELDDLAAARAVVPGAAGSRLLAVCPAGVRSRAEPDLAVDADMLLAAWNG